MKSIFTLLLLSLMGLAASAQTPLLEKKGRGEIESESFVIERPATLIISCKTDSGNVEEYSQASVELQRDKGSEIETVEYWTLDLAETKLAKDQRSFRVRVEPGKYFLEIDSVGDVSWGIRLVHTPQSDRYSLREVGNRFVIELDGHEVAMSADKEVAKTITRLLNARSS